MEDFAGLVTKPKLCLGSEDCGLRSVLLSPCHCAGTQAALSSEAGGGFCSSELALCQSLLLPEEGMFILFFCSSCTEKGEFFPRLWLIWFVVPLPQSESPSPDCITPLPGASFLKLR